MQQPGAAGMVPPGGVASLMGQMPPGMGGPMPQPSQSPLFAAIQQQAPNLPQSSAMPQPPRPQGGSFMAPRPQGGSLAGPPRPRPQGGMGKGIASMMGRSR
jgi:hypothetical protein